MDTGGGGGSILHFNAALQFVFFPFVKQTGSNPPCHILIKLCVLEGKAGSSEIDLGKSN